MRPTPRPTLTAVLLLALVSVAVGVLAALADGADGASPRLVRAAPLPAAPPPASPPVDRPCRANSAAQAAYRVLGGPSVKTPTPEPVPQGLLDAFGVLRRDPTVADSLPESALRALRLRGLEPFDPAAARLLRTTVDGGRAWVVPVRDATPRMFAALLACPGPVAMRLSRRRVRGRPVAPSVRLVPPRRSASPTAPAAAPVAPIDPALPALRRPTRPQPGLAVVAIGSAPAGEGGTLGDIVRGRAPLIGRPCGGPDLDMLTVSGIVPDGVAAAFLTSPDGTAVRADVKDNAYAFVVPYPKHFDQRYVVWSGADGTPHVVPVVPALRGRCQTLSTLPHVSPGP